MPDFSRLKLANNELRRNKRFYNNIRLELSEEELRRKNKLDKDLQKKLQEHQNSLDLGPNKLDQVHMDELIRLSNAKREKIRRELNKIHNNKLAKLGIRERIDSKFINKDRRGINKRENVEMADPIFNLSSKHLNDNESRLLSKGLKFGIKAKKVDTFEILARFEELAGSLNYLPIAEKEDPIRANLNSKSNFFRQLQGAADEFVKLSKKADDNLSREERGTLTELSKDKSIVISKADKGNAVVIQNTDDYRRKINGLLTTGNKFKEIPTNPTRTREKKLQDYLRSLHANDNKGIRREYRISDEVYRRILPSGSRAGVMYGLPKIHKNGSPLRPIISAVKTYNYELAKYLDEILKPFINNTYMLVDTYDFVNKVSKLDTNSSRYMVSFDVESLFTNVPTNETIEIILNEVYKGDRTIFHNLTREELELLLRTCTQESHFQFNGKY